MKRKNILKVAGNLLIAALMILSTIAATANTVKDQKPETELIGMEASDTEQPIPRQFDGVWLHYDTGKPQWKWGAVYPYIAHDAIVLTPEILAPYDSWSVKEVMFYHFADPGSEPHNTEVIIYEGNNTISPETTLTTEDFIAEGSGWQNFILSSPAIVDASKYLWVSVKIHHAPDEYPMYADTTVSYPGLSDKYYYPIYGWLNLSDFDYNQSWLLRARVAKEPDLDCEGELRWENIVPGTAITGNFTVKNAGDPGSELNWTVSEYPSTWGSNWNFSPASGTGLTPEAGPITVIVSVVALPDENTVRTGTVKIINSDDFSDSCPINVYMETPRNKAANYPFLYRMFERFPNLFPMLRYLLGF